MNRCNEAGQKGGALILVLWAALLVSAILAVAIATVRIDAHMAIAEAESLKAREAARSALEIAAFNIAEDVSNSSANQTHQRVSLNGYEVVVAPSIDSQKIDINLASETTLVNFFIMLGEDIDEAQALAARIADWRDGDDLSRPNGAERSDYGRARNGEKIGNRSFHSVAELSLVLDMPEELLECASPALTVLGDDGMPDGTLLTALYGRSMNLPQQATSTRLGTSSRRIVSGRRYSLTATARSPNGREYRLTGLFRITGGQTPYEFIAVYPAAMPPSPKACEFAGEDG